MQKTGSRGKNIDYSKYRDYNLDSLSDREKEILLLKISGKKNKEIAAIYNTTSNNVSSTLYNSACKLDTGYHRNRRTKTKKYDYTKYSECNLDDSLTRHQANILKHKMQGKSNLEISSICGISAKSVSKILSASRKRLDTGYVKPNKKNAIKCPYPSLECLPKKFIKVFMMSQSGLSVEEIVKKEKISMDSINNILYLCNLKINSSDENG